MKGTVELSMFAHHHRPMGATLSTVSVPKTLPVKSNNPAGGFTGNSDRHERPIAGEFPRTPAVVSDPQFAYCEVPHSVRPLAGRITVPLSDAPTHCCSTGAQFNRQTVKKERCEQNDQFDSGGTWRSVVSCDLMYYRVAAPEAGAAHLSVAAGSFIWQRRHRYLNRFAVSCSIWLAALNAWAFTW